MRFSQQSITGEKKIKTALLKTVLETKENIFSFFFHTIDLGVINKSDHLNG